jgi:hypothetical protein
MSVFFSNDYNSIAATYLKAACFEKTAFFSHQNLQTILQTAGC